MTSFASAADLQLLDPTLSDDMADLVLDMVSNGIRAGVGWQVDEFTGIKVVQSFATSDRFSSVILPGRNLSNVTVVLDGTLGESGIEDGTLLEEGVDYILNEDAGTIDLEAPVCGGTISVEFTAGWTPATLPGIFRTVALDWALQYASNPTNVRQYTIGKISETFATSSRTLGSATALMIEDPRLAAYSLGPGF